MKLDNNTILFLSITLAGLNLIIQFVHHAKSFSGIVSDTNSLIADVPLSRNIDTNLRSQTLVEKSNVDVDAPSSVTKTKQGGQSTTTTVTSDLQLPRILLAGVQKSGSTAVADFLHRAGVCLSRPDPAQDIEQKSVYYFDKNYDRGIDYYASMFAHCKDKEGAGKVGMDLATDATPNNFRMARRIRRTYDQVSPDQLKKLKIIVVVREPVARELSWYNHLVSECMKHPDEKCDSWKLAKKEGGSTNPIENMKSFHEYAHDLFGEFMDGKPIPIEKSRPSSFYERYLQEWYELFNPKQILFLNYSELKQDERNFLGRIASFLELDVDDSLMDVGTSTKNTQKTSGKVSTAPCELQNRLAAAFKEPNEKFYKMLDEIDGSSLQQKPFPRFQLSNCTATSTSTAAVVMPRELNREEEAEAEGKNLVMNSDFKDGTSSNWKFDASTGEATFGIVTGKERGSYAVSITGGSVSQEMGSKLKGGILYKVSAFVQVVDSAPHDAQVSFVESPEGKVYTGAKGRVDKVDTWVQIQGTYTPSKESSSIRMYVNAPSSSKLLVDSVSVVEADCDFNHFVRDFNPDKLDLTCKNFGELEMGEEVGRGRSRKVSVATWKGTKVAVKEYVKSGRGSARIMREAALMGQLNKSNNIVKLIGMCDSTLVFEYAPNNLKKFVMDKTNDISVEKALLLGLDMVKGLAQLHSVGPVVHGDLHLEQYLFSPDGGKVLLGDLESSHYVGPNMSGKGRCTFSKVKSDLAKSSPSIFHSPERLALNDNLDEKDDIYRVALALWSLLSRRLPYIKKIKRDNFKDLVVGGERPSMDLVSEYPQEMKDLIVEAWDSDPRKRPTAADMVTRMQSIVKKYSISDTIR